MVTGKTDKKQQITLLKAAGLKANILWIKTPTEMLMKRPKVRNGCYLQVFTVVRRKRNIV